MRKMVCVFMAMVLSLGNIGVGLAWEDSGVSGLQVGINPTGDLFWRFEKNVSQEEQTKIIGKFLTALSVPEEDKVVNLNLGLTDVQVIKPSLMFTSLGKDLVESDLTLKIVVQDKFAKLVNAGIIPESSVGNMYRVWILPEVVNIVSNHKKAMVTRVRLDVKIETKDRQLSVLLKRYLLPDLKKIVNSSEKFATLRKDIGIIALSWWVKQNISKESKYFPLIDSRYHLSIGEESWTVYSYLINYIHNFYGSKEDSLFGIFSGGLDANVSGKVKEKKGEIPPYENQVELDLRDTQTGQSKKEKKMPIEYFGEFGGEKLTNMVTEVQNFAKKLREGVSDKATLSEREKLLFEISRDGEKPRLGWSIPVDREKLSKWLDSVKQAVGDKKAYIFVGMGGSINTIKMMKDLFGIKNVLPLDNPDGEFIKMQIDNFKKELGIELKDIGIISISKSATTFETHQISNILKGIYSENGLDIYDYITWLIDVENKGKLEERGWSLKKLNILPIQPDGQTDIGGRFTCPRTALFLLPAYIIEDEKLVKDVMDIVDEEEKNPSFIEKWFSFARDMVKKDEINDRIAIVLPDYMATAYEPMRVWINQLIQESLGGKVDGFDPKTVVLLESEFKEIEKDKNNNILTRSGIIVLDFRPLGHHQRIGLYSSSGKNKAKLYYVAALTLALEYLTQSVAERYSNIRGELFNAFTQPNVQLYKEKMKKIEKITPSTPVGLLTVFSDIEKKLQKEDKDFVEIVYYGPDDELYNKLQEFAKAYFHRRKVSFVFRGPDWNHHAFQASPTCKHTLFAVLVDERADESVKKVAQATKEVFEERSVPYVYHWIGENFKNGVLWESLCELSKASQENRDKVLAQVNEKIKQMAKGSKNAFLRVKGVSELRQDISLALEIVEHLQSHMEEGEWKKLTIITKYNIEKRGFEDIFNEVLKVFGIREGDIVYDEGNTFESEGEKNPGGIWVDFNRSPALVFSSV